MTFRPRLTLLAASVALALAGVAHAQTPAPATTTTPAPSATAPATSTTPPAGTAATPPAKDRGAKRAAQGTPKSGAPTGTPGIAAVPGAAPSGAQAAKPERSERSAKRSTEGGGSGRQLQNVYADLMTPEEMAAHRKKVKQTKTYAECKSLFETTGKEMEARAKAQNKTIKETPTEICDRAKERGRLTG